MDSVGYGRFSPRDDAGFFALGIGSSRVVTLFFGFGLCLGWRVVRSWSSFSNVLLERCYLDVPPYFVTATSAMLNESPGAAKKTKVGDGGRTQLFCRPFNRSDSLSSGSIRRMGD